MATPPASPRKSSTSYGNRSLRPRYLGIEVAGESPVPTRAIESALAARLRAAIPGGIPVRVRLIRREGDRAILEVEHRQADAARAAWNGTHAIPGGSFHAATRRTWGTLRGAKSWLRAVRRGREAPVP